MSLVHAHLSGNLTTQCLSVTGGGSFGECSGLSFTPCEAAQKLKIQVHDKNTQKHRTVKQTAREHDRNMHRKKNRKQ